MHSVVRSVQLRAQAQQAASQLQRQQVADQPADQQKATLRQVDVMVADQQATAQHHAAEDNLRFFVKRTDKQPLDFIESRGCLLSKKTKNSTYTISEKK